tara:strand:- start:219 stop:512 length:294 start_codon:yes stop_codon:yes gene_type:complete
MIDTDKYEGHTEGLWFDGEATEISNAIYHGLIQLHPNELGKANARLAVDAPLLLAEVKRLHNHIRRMRHWAEPKMHEIHHDAWRKLHEEIYEGDDEE